MNNKKKDNEKQSLMIATGALALIIFTSIPAEIDIEHPRNIIAVICYAAAAIALIIQWIRFFLRYRNKDDE